MRVQAGLKPEDWQRWGQFTTFKSNAAELLRELAHCTTLRVSFSLTTNREEVRKL